MNGEFLLQEAFNSLKLIVTTNINNYGQTVAMARMMLRKRYSGSVLGVIWAIVKPTFYFFIYWFVMTIGIRGSRTIEGVSYAMWMIPGITAWFFLSDVLTRGGVSILSNKHLVTKLVYPIDTIPVSEVLSLFFVHLAMLAIATTIFILSGFGIGIYLLQLPYYVLCSFLLSLAIAFLLSSLTAVSKDIKHMINSFMTGFFWLTPVLWSIVNITSPLRQIILMNPLAYVVLGYRDSFVSRTWFFQKGAYTLYFWAFLIVLTLLAALVHNKLRHEYADVL